MKDTSAAVIEHLSRSATTLCMCVKVTRTDSEVFGFTDHDRSLIVDGVTFTATRGITLSAITTSSGMDVDNVDVDGYLGDVTEDDVRASLWDGAAVNVFEVDWTGGTVGLNRLKRGIIGEITIEDNKLRIEIRGLSQKLQAPIGETCSRFCKADLFDTRCKVVDTEGEWKFSASVVTAFDPQRTITFGALTQAADFFTNGKLECTTGDNDGFTREIKLHTTGSPSGAIIEIFEAFPYDIEAGDEFTVWAGCQKRYEEDCIDKFDNGINFRGFPWLPGPDDSFEGPI